MNVRVGDSIGIDTKFSRCRTTRQISSKGGGEGNEQT